MLTNQKTKGLVVGQVKIIITIEFANACAISVQGSGNVYNLGNILGHRDGKYAEIISTTAGSGGAIQCTMSGFSSGTATVTAYGTGSPTLYIYMQDSSGNWQQKGAATLTISVTSIKNSSAGFSFNKVAICAYGTSSASHDI